MKLFSNNPNKALYNNLILLSTLDYISILNKII